MPLFNDAKDLSMYILPSSHPSFESVFAQQRSFARNTIAQPSLEGIPDHLNSNTRRSLGTSRSPMFPSVSTEDQQLNALPDLDSEQRPVRKSPRQDRVDDMKEVKVTSPPPRI